MAPVCVGLPDGGQCRACPGGLRDVSRSSSAGLRGDVRRQHHRPRPYGSSRRDRPGLEGLVARRVRQRPAEAAASAAAERTADDRCRRHRGDDDVVDPEADAPPRSASSFPFRRRCGRPAGWPLPIAAATAVVPLLIRRSPGRSSPGRAPHARTVRQPISASQALPPARDHGAARERVHRPKRPSPPLSQAHFHPFPCAASAASSARIHGRSSLPSGR